MSHFEESLPHTNEFPRESTGDQLFHPVSRRGFLQSTGIVLGGTALAQAGTALTAAERRPRVAAIFTVCRYRSHAHVLLENFLEPYLFNGRLTEPGVEVVSFYADQTAKEDMTRDVARQYKIPVFKSIREALCLGGRRLAVDAVLSVGEHGNYPVNKLGQREYPRKRFFDEAVAVMRQSDRFVPLFNDKHLSYRWDWAKEMFDTARRLRIPFMAGSSVPLAQRIPPLEVPARAEFTEVLALHGGPPESYDFHALEVLQSLVESRKGGETGIARVEFLRGEALWKAARERRWSTALAEAALAADLGKRPSTLRGVKGELADETHALLLTYKDGLRGTVLKVGDSSTRWGFACRLKGEEKVRACRFYPGPWENRNLFKALAHAIQQHFREGRAPYPVERTLLTTGALEAAMRSRAAGKVLATPHLEFAYAARDFRPLREMGASWKILTEKTPQPRGINSDAKRK
jgi:hypothetical protein